MKITLEYTLPEEREEFNLAKNGSDYYLALTEFAELLRKYRKHGLPNDVPELVVTSSTTDFELAQVMNDHLEQKFYEILRERGIDL